MEVCPPSSTALPKDLVNSFFMEFFGGVRSAVLYRNKGSALQGVLHSRDFANMTLFKKTDWYCRDYEVLKVMEIHRRTGCNVVVTITTWEKRVLWLHANTLAVRVWNLIKTSCWNLRALRDSFELCAQDEFRI